MGTLLTQPQSSTCENQLQEKERSLREFGEGSVDTWLVFRHILREQRGKETDMS